MDSSLDCPWGARSGASFKAAIIAEVKADLIATIGSNPLPPSSVLENVMQPEGDGAVPDEPLPGWAQKLMLEVDELKLWRMQQSSGAPQPLPAERESTTGDEKMRSETALPVAIRPIAPSLTDATVAGSATAQDEQSTRVDETCASVELKDSMWDAVLLVGLRGQGISFTVSAQALLASILNVLVQAMLTYIVAKYLTETTIDTATAAALRFALHHFSAGCR